MSYSVYSPFNIELHKANFIDYLEVIIDEEGAVHYAIPSHQEFLIVEACKRTGLTRQELENACPPDMYCDYMLWLSEQANAVAVWNEFCICQTVNEKQQTALRKLKNAGLYFGKIPICR